MSDMRNMNSETGFFVHSLAAILLKTLVICGLKSRSWAVPPGLFRIPRLQWDFTMHL